MQFEQRSNRFGLFPCRSGASAGLCGCLVAIMVIVLAGCQTDRVTTSDGRPMPKQPTTGPRAPEQPQINRMAFMVSSKPEDTTGTGYPDLILVTVALFALPHPTSLHADGVFEFSLYERGQARKADAEPLARWRMEGSEVDRARAVAGYGPCYQFALSLVDAGSEIFPLTSADLRCTFHPADGSPPVRSDGVRSIQIGKRVTDGRR